MNLNFFSMPIALATFPSSNLMRALKFNLEFRITPKYLHVSLHSTTNLL